MLPKKSFGVSVFVGFALGLLTLSALASPVYSAGAVRGGTATTGLGAMYLGVNAWPDAAASVSLAAGVQYYRVEATFNNATILGINTEARTNGVDYLGILDGSTMGVTRGGTAFHQHCLTNCYWTLNDWNATVRQALAVYPAIHEWEIWNEPYSPTQHSGYLTNASRYVSILHSAYSIIKANSKNDTVVCLGGSAVADSSAMTFTEQVWSDGASKYCDAISLHAYVAGTALFNTSRYENEEWPKNLRQFENVTGKPIWVTEFGRQSAEAITTQHYSQQNQVDFLQQAMGIFENNSAVKRAYVYNLAGLSDPPYNADYGLLNATTFKAKLAWHAFLTMYGKSLSHAAVPKFSEQAPSLKIAHLTIAKLTPDKITASAPSGVDPIVIKVDNSTKALGTGNVSYSFTGNALRLFNITALDRYTGLTTSGGITVI